MSKLEVLQNERNIQKSDSKKSAKIWQVFFVSSIIFNYFFTSFVYLHTENVTKISYYTILLCDIIYGINYFLAIFLQKFRFKLILLIDFFFAFPYSYPYASLIGSNDIVFITLRFMIILRFVHVVIYFKQQWNTMGSNFVINFTIQYLLIFLITIHTIACFHGNDYFDSIYIAIVFTTNRNFGDITYGAKIITIFLMLIGFFSTSVFIASLSFFLQLKYKRQRELMAERKRALLYSDSEFTKNFYDLLWTKKCGVYGSQMFDELPPPLKSEICIDLTIDFLQTSIIFQNKSDAFLRVVANLIKHEFLQTNEVVFKRNVAKNKMIFIVRGAIEILSDEDDESSVIVLNSGSVLGEVALFLTVPSKCTVRAVTYTDLQVLYRKDFLTVINFFPQIFTTIRRNVLQRIVKKPLESEDKIELNHFFSKKNTKATSVLKKALKNHDDSNFFSLYQIGKPKSQDMLCVSEKFPFILHPSSSLKKLWDYFVLFVIFYTTITFPYFIIFETTLPEWFKLSYIFIDIFYVLDVVIILTTAIDGKTKFNEIVQTSLNHLNFYLDFLSCIKIETFYWIWTQNQRYHEVLRLNRLLKIYRVPKYLEQCKLLFYLILTCYWCGALLFLTTCFNTICTNDGWYVMKLMQVLEEKLSSSFIFNKILTSFYFALSSWSGFTPGDILPRNFLDRILVTIIMIIGAFTFNCCVSQKCAWSDLCTTKEKQKSKYFVVESKAFFIQNQIEDTMKMFRKLPFLKNCDQNFIFALVRKTQILSLPPNEYITRKGDILKMIYIIQQGYCLQKKHVLLGSGQFFATVSFFTNIHTLCTVKTVTHVKLFYIKEEDFWTSASQFPGTVRYFRETSANFNVAEEFKQIPTYRTEDTEINASQRQSSILYLIAFCKKHQEKYNAPFRELGVLCWTQFLLIPICILPQSLLLKIWLIIRSIIATIITVLTPFQIIQKPYCTIINNVLLLGDIVSYFDLYIMLFVGYHGEKQQLVVHPLKTAIHYLKGRFILDFTLCFPWHIIVSYFFNEYKENYNVWYHLENIVRFIKMGQIYRLFHFLPEVKQIKLAILMIILIHFWSAILIINSCMPEFTQNSTTITCKEDSWFQKTKFNHPTNPYEVYLTAMYFSTQILSLTGLGDVVPQTSSTIFIVIFMIMLTLLILTHIYGANKKFCDEDTTMEDLEELQKFMRPVDRKMQSQISQQIEYKWKRKLDTATNHLTPGLLQDFLSQKYSVLKDVSIFKNVDLRIFNTIFNERRYLKQETIYENDTILDEFCIITRGFVKMFSKSSGVEAIVTSGAIFGNFTPNLHKISLNVVALTNVDVIYVKSRSFYTILKKHKQEERKILKNIPERRDFIIPQNSDTDFHILDTTDVNTLMEFKANILAVLLICLPWKLFRFTIPQKSIFFTIFDIYCLLLTYVSTIFVTYEFAFQNHAPFLLYFGIYADITFIVKILVEMHKTYENEFGEIVTTNNLIIIKYFEKRTRRILELFINSPIYYFAFLAKLSSNLDTELIFSSLKLLTLFRLWYFVDYYQEKISQLKCPKFFLKFGAIVVWGTILIHILTCGWYLTACPLVFCFKNSWTNNVNDKYMTSLYFVITLLTRTGIGDIVPNNNLEQIYAIFVMLLSIFLTGCLIGKIWNLLHCISLSLVKYNTVILELKQFVKNNGISKFQQKKLTKYVQQLWTLNKGNQIPKAMTELNNPTIQNLMFELYGSHLQKSYIFADTETAFLKQLCQYFRKTLIFPENYIVQHGDYNSTMYFIHQGKVDIISVHSNLTETVHEVLQSGDIFGVLQGLYHNVPHYFSFRARTTVHMVTLCLSDWEHLLELFPESKETIYSKSNKVNV